MHHHEAAAANIAGIGQSHGQCKTHGHGGVHGVAPGLENVHANLRGQFLLAGHHAISGLHGMEDIHAKVIGRCGGLRCTGLNGFGGRRSRDCRFLVSFAFRCVAACSQADGGNRQAGGECSGA